MRLPRPRASSSRPIARAAGARLAVVEMPPGPPVLQTLVAEIHGPDAATRRQVAQQMTDWFEQVPNLVDVDNLISEPYARWHFAVDLEKAARRNVSVEAILRNVEMAVGGYPLGDAKRGSVLEPVRIVIQVPHGTRSKLARLADLPIQSDAG